jgi:hypothetical protein
MMLVAKDKLYNFVSSTGCSRTTGGYSHGEVMNLELTYEILRMRSTTRYKSTCIELETVW